MRALTPKRILTNPFFSVEYFALLYCINRATVVLIELRYLFSDFMIWFEY